MRLNTAVADAFGLSWKLAWVLRGWAGTALLGTHVEERGPVGRHNLGLAASRSAGGTPAPVRATASTVRSAGANTSATDCCSA